MKDTLIQWCDSTVSPSAGCDGCELWLPLRGGSCYAGAIHNRFSPSKAYPGSFDQVTLHPGRIAAAAKWSDLRGKDRPTKPWLNGMPRMIFLSDMSDAMSQDVPWNYLYDEIIANVSSELGSRHVWMWLTKQPKRMCEFSTTVPIWPKNLWVGTSVTTQATTSRATELLRIRDARHFLSVEPLWEHVDLHRRELLCKDYPDGITIGKYLDLVIIGGESGPKAKPMDIKWVRSLIRQCRETNTPAFVKQLGAWPYDSFPNGRPEPTGQRIHLKDSHGGAWDEWPDAALKVREFPKV